MAEPRYRAGCYGNLTESECRQHGLDPREASACHLPGPAFPTPAGRPRQRSSCGCTGGEKAAEAKLNAAIDKARRSLVTVENQPVGRGRGFIISPAGLIATCAHAVKGAEALYVDYAGQRYDAHLLEADERHDVAVIRIKARYVPRIDIAFGWPARGSSAISFAQGEPFTGEIFKHNVGIRLRDGREHEGLMSIMSDARKGDSGSPVLNDRGELIGMLIAVQAQDEPDEIADPIAYVVPAAGTLKEMIDRHSWQAAVGMFFDGLRRATRREVAKRLKVAAALGEIDMPLSAIIKAEKEMQIEEALAA